MRYLVIISLILTAAPAWAADGFTQQDRELLIELSVRVEELEKRMVQGFENVDKRFEQIDKRFEQVDKRFEQVDNRFEQVNNRFGDVDNRFEQVNNRFGDVDSRFGDMFDYFYILTGIFTTIMVASIGFAFWDRRTVIRQARKEAIEFIEQEGLTRRMLEALRTAAQENETLAKAMRSSHLL